MASGADKPGSPKMRLSDASRTDDRPPLWAALATVALFAAGFRPRRLSTAPIGDERRRPISDEGRGRLATTPSAIPARGWTDILRRLYRNISEHRVIALAAGVTFYSLLAIFPAIAALVAVYGLFADPATLTAHLQKLSGLLPGGAIDVIRDQLTRVASQRGSTLGVTFLVGLAVSLWSANAAMKSIFDTLNIVYAEKEKRSLVQLNAVSLAFTAAGILFVLLAIGALVVLPPVLKYLGLSGATELLWDWRSSTATARPARSRNGGGSAGEARSPRSAGWRSPCYSHGMRRISGISTRPTDRWAPSSAS
jgi:membrane protein